MRTHDLKRGGNAMSRMRVAATFIAMTLLLASPLGVHAASPLPSPSATTTPVPPPDVDITVQVVPKGTYTLPSGGSQLWKGDAGKCYYLGQPGSWTLRGDPRARPRVWMQKGARAEPLRLPDGWHARFGPKLSIADATGTVRYRGGETCEGNTGTGG